MTYKQDFLSIATGFVIFALIEIQVWPMAVDALCKDIIICSD